MRFPVFLFFLFVSTLCFGQNLQQTVRGQVVDGDSRYPLTGAVVVLVKDTVAVRSAMTDAEGRFRFDEVNVGRYNILIRYIGYEDLNLPNIEITSGKEVVMPLEMRETYLEGERVEIIANGRKDKPNNEMVTVSGRVFTIEETTRYAGSLGDPARMASNFAGVVGANDARNDIIIRGNSPSGLLWRFEGIDIPSPNHFSAQGTTGGPVSMLNTNLLRNSDFLTGAWPSEYGNALSGVFDLKMRNGNNEKYEFLFQAGFNGLEAMAEGPISKKSGASFMASYRYSVLGFVEKIGINVGTGGVPRYQDFTFKVSLPGKKNSQTEVFGIAGKSEIEVLDSRVDEKDISFGISGLDVRYGSQLGVLGISNVQQISKKSYWKNIFAISAEGHTTDADSLDLDRNPQNFYDEKATYVRQSWHSFFNHKANANNTLRAGFLANRLAYSNFQQVYIRFPFVDTLILSDAEGSTYLLQPYAMWRHQFSSRLTMNAGVHSQLFLLNATSSIEPRLGFRYQLNEKQTLSLGYGLHGQIQNLSVYFYEQPTRDFFGRIISTERTNDSLGFTRSHHLVAGYDHLLGKNLRLKIEAYFQYLFNVPIQPGTTYSVLNVGADFRPDPRGNLVNEGLGRNYGVEMTFEKFFSSNYFFLLTTSLFNSEYQGVDEVWRNTAFNSQYVVNALIGKDFVLSQKARITFSGRVTNAGGRWYTPLNSEASKARREPVYYEDQAYTQHYPDYFRLDARLGFKLNLKNTTQEWAIDVQNITNHQNVLTQNYNPNTNSVELDYQLGVFPMVLYRIWF